MRRILGTLGLLTGICAATASAQSAPRTAAPPRSSSVPADAPVYARQGMWFSAGLGAGAASIHCQICEGEQGTRGTSGYMRAGTTVNGRLLLGAEVNGWLRSDETGRQRVVALTGDGYWYPNPRHGYYFKFGFGLSRYKQWATDDNNEELTTGISTGGFTGQIGTGYEVRVNPKMSFVPYFNVIGTAQGTLATERDDGTNYQRNKLPNRANVILFQLGVGVTWH